MLISNSINSQSLLKTYDSIIGAGNENIKYITDSLINESGGSLDYVVASSIAHKFSINQFINSNYKEAIHYANIEIEFFEKSNSTYNSDYINALYNLGFFYTKNEQYILSNSVFQSIIDLDVDQNYSARSYGSIGQNYQFLGDYSKSIEYLKKSINLLESLKDYRNLLTQRIYLTNVYLLIEDKKHAQLGIKEADFINELKSKISFNDGMTEGLHNIYGNFYSILGDNYYDRAGYNYFKRLEINLRTNDRIKLGGTYSSLAYLYNLKRNDSAGYFAKKSIELTRSEPYKYLIAYGNYIDYYIIEGNLHQALHEIDYIIDYCFESISRENNINNLFYLNHKLDILDFYARKQEILNNLFITSNNDHYLELLINSVKYSDKLSRILEDSTTDYSTKLFWRGKASQAYLYGAYASHLLGDVEKAFEFMEKNKALLLSESILKNTEFANLPKHISDEETRRKKLIYSLEEKLSNDSRNTALQDSLFVAKRSREKYIDSLKLVYPKYFARKIDVQQVSLKEVKEELKENQAIVSYIWNDFDRDKELLVGLVSTNNSSKSFVIEDINELTTLLNDYQQLVSKPFQTKKDQQDFREVAYHLYDQLFPNEVKDLISGKDLVIIADGLLQSIPFESLITKKKSNEYLLLSNNIHYSYSYSFLKHNDKVRRVSKNTFIGYSPVSFKDSVLINLNNSKVEIEKIGKHFSGIIKENEVATKKDFLDNSSDSKIIHLATHADASNNPWIAFSDNKLNLNELYTYKNNAELVVLSACSTSLGEIAQGEGVISLARGFFHSGSKSVISSLWRVNDKSTTDIMSIFYNNLSKGQTKSIALNNAKREYLSSHSLSDQSPYYWSSFVLIGDAGEIDLPSNNYLLYGSILLLIPIGFLIKKNLRKAG